jgi:REP element-mobilizing transposase RayT
LDVTPPRHIVPDQLCFVTARTIGRMFLLLPEPRVVQLIGFIFALAVQKYGLLVHEVMFLSNHFHMLATDVDGRLPEFMAYLDSLLARSLNAIRGRSGTVFEKHYNLVVVTGEEAVLEHAKYTLANPCAAHLVRRSRHWKGFSSRSMRYGQPVTFKRPKLGLWRKPMDEPNHRMKAMDPGRAKRRHKPSKLPETVQFTLHRPPVREGLTDDEVRAEVLRRLDEREMELIRERSKQGIQVAGMDKVLAQKWYSFPGAPEDMFKTTPKVSGRSKWLRIEALGRLAWFEQAYRRARERFAQGMRDVLWPRGTWLMCVRHGLPCEQPP